MSNNAKFLLFINGVLATSALNPAVQNAIAAFVAHHPFLTVLGAALSSVGHLLTDPKSNRSLYS